MVKINTIARPEQSYQRETKFDIQKIQRSTNPQLHQFQKAREFQRALVATKIDKIFAQPFLGVLTGHSDAISCMAKCQNNLLKFISGSFDGEIKSWDISQRKQLFQLNAHNSGIKGICFSIDGQRFLSSADDKVINLYDYQQTLQNYQKKNYQPMQKYLSKIILGNVDHMYKDDYFATAGQVVQVWNYERSKPYLKFEWGADTVLKVKFNPSDTHLLAGTGIDSSLVLYDTRGENPLQKINFPNKCHALCWNYTEPINLIVGSDDSNCYTYDIRNMSKAKMIHKDHIQAILDLDVAPTGKEFVTGSFDKTVRIFNTNEGKSREVFHGKRMQLVYSVQWSMDNEYVLSGSDDMNIRIWKSKPSKPLGIIQKRHENTLNYRETIKEKFKYVKEIKRIANHRNLPKYVLTSKKRKYEQKLKKFRINKNMELNNPGMWQKPKPERETKTVGVQE